MEHTPSYFTSVFEIANNRSIKKAIGRRRRRGVAEWEGVGVWLKDGDSMYVFLESYFC